MFRNSVSRLLNIAIIKIKLNQLIVKQPTFKNKANKYSIPITSLLVYYILLLPLLLRLPTSIVFVLFKCYKILCSCASSPNFISSDIMLAAWIPGNGSIYTMEIDVYYKSALLWYPHPLPDSLLLNIYQLLNLLKFATVFGVGLKSTF